MRSKETNAKPIVGEAINALEFKDKCLKLMDSIAESGGELTITKKGKPVAKLVPYNTAESLFDMFESGEVEIHGDIIEPNDEEWAALDDGLDEGFYT